MTKFTAQDVENALEDERHHGYGLMERAYLPTGKAARLTRLVAEVASGIDEMTHEDLFKWVDSKYARHLCDEFQDQGGRLDAETARRVVSGYLNINAVRTLRAGL